MATGNLVNGKMVKLQLVGLDGNAFYLMGAFSQAARRQGWTKEEIDKILTECKSSDYDHLLVTLMNHCEDPEPDYENYEGPYAYPDTM